VPAPPAASVVTDPKGELWEYTSGEQPHAWRFAPREPEQSRCCNWIPLCQDPRTADLLAAAAMQTDRPGGGDPFWPLAEAQVCSALFAHTASLGVPTPATAYALLTQGPRGLLAALRESPALGARQCAAMLGDLRVELLASIVLGVSNKLAWLKEPAVQRFTSAELTAPDFRILAQQPTAVYWVLHEQDVALLQPLSSLFFTLLLDQLGSAKLPEPRAADARRVCQPGGAAALPHNHQRGAGPGPRPDPGGAGAVASGGAVRPGTARRRFG